ncbi:hypothetical protein AVEN_66017-1, partial [Araneus ventricosus]
RLISVHGVQEIHRRKAERVYDSCLSACRCHWGNAASLGTFSNSEVDGSRWEQDPDYRRDGQTLPTEPLQQLLCAQRRMRKSVVVVQSLSDSHLFQHQKRFLTNQHFPSADDVQTDGCHRLAPFQGGEFLCVIPFSEIGLTVYRNLNSSGSYTER